MGEVHCRGRLKDHRRLPAGGKVLPARRMGTHLGFLDARDLFQVLLELTLFDEGLGRRVGLGDHDALDFAVDAPAVDDRPGIGLERGEAHVSGDVHVCEVSRQELLRRHLFAGPRLQTPALFQSVASRPLFYFQIIYS